MLAAYLICGSALADTSGKELYAWCKAPTGSTGEVACTTYTVGVYDGAMFWWALKIGLPRTENTGVKSTHDAPACIRTGLAHADMVNVVKGYLAANPQLLDLDAAVLVLNAMAGSFPCGIPEPRR